MALTVSPHALTLATDAAAEAVTRLLDGGRLRLSSSTAMLVELPFSSPAFGPPERGVCVARPIADEVDAQVAGTVTHFEAVSADGRVVVRGTVGPASANPDLVMSEPDIRLHARVHVATFQYRARS